MSLVRDFDPITLEILWARLISLVDEAAATFSRASFSTLVREANDYSVVLTDAEGRSIAQSTKSIPSFTGTIPASVRAMLSRYPKASLGDGDVLITNDPWLGTGHIHDLTIVRPIFHRGRLVAFAGVASHLPDIGGRLRGSGNREIFEEGLQIPIVKLIEGGRRNETLIEMIARNVRVPDHTLGDIFAAVSGCETLARRLSGILQAEQIDLDALAASLQARSEAVMRAAIADVPDGDYGYALEHDGFEERVTVACRLCVSGDRILVDYDGTSPQLPRAVNVVPAYRFAYTAYGVKCALAPEVPNNDGAVRPISTRAPEGSVLNPRYPAATGARNLIGHLLPVAVMGALAPVLGERAMAEGTGNSSFTMTGEHLGRRYAVVNFLNAGQGATAARPGMDVLSFPSNLGNTPIEVMEQLAPIRIRHRRIRLGSGGAGAQRGGQGLSITFEFLGASPAVCSFIPTRRLVAAKGLAGGAAGALASISVNAVPIDPAEQQILTKGDVVEYHTAGGGGYGPRR